MLRSFNPRTRVGCDQCGAESLALNQQFQSTHPRGVRRVRPFSSLQYFRVSIHAPAWGATSSSSAKRLQGEEFQSTHPRGVRRVRPFSSLQYFRVSIHAPAWGATRGPDRPGAHSPRFNPRTRVGCDTIIARLGGFVLIGFNPRTRVGCDRQLRSWFFAQHGVVSIHAPAWGATRAHGQSAPAPDGFNPRTRVGCDHLVLSIFHAVHCFNPRTRVGCDIRIWSRSCPFLWFQSTHPRGVRPGHAEDTVLSVRCFNPRTRVGCDGRRGLRGRKRMGLFQSTHPRGVRPALMAKALQPQTVSIHAPAWGATCRLNRLTRTASMFQSTHPRGVRQCSTDAHRCYEYVSIHAPAWGATC